MPTIWSRIAIKLIRSFEPVAKGPCSKAKPGGAVEKFNKESLEHLNPIRWDDANHQRAAAAILVNAVYILESGDEEDASSWYQFVGFERLRDYDFVEENNIFGAIFQHRMPPAAASAPLYVIAFRGTANLWDAALDCSLTSEIGIKGFGRLNITKEVGQRFFKELKPPPRSVWLTGHSLGASVASLLALHLATAAPPPTPGFQVKDLRTLLFNAPFIYVNTSDKLAARLLKRVEKWIAAVLNKSGVGKKEVARPDVRGVLYEWVPELYVNKHDLICKWFINYFQAKENELATDADVLAWLEKKMGGKLKIMAPWTERSASIFFIPSGKLIMPEVPTLSSAEGIVEKIRRLVEQIERLKQAHGLRQWWQNGLAVKSVTHMHPLAYMHPVAY